MKDNALTNKIYIPPRFYARLERIYTDKATVVSAPVGCGKTTMVREFISRSRKNGMSCRFIRSAKSVSDCFSQVCRIVLGHEAFSPETDGQFTALRHETALANADNVLIVVDCHYVTEAFLENLRAAELFIKSSSARLVIISDNLHNTHIDAAKALGISVITESDLKFTPSEVEEYFRYCSVECNDIERISALADGQAIRLKLCLKLASLGVTPVSGSVTELAAQYMQAAMTREELGAFICAASIDNISDDYLHSLVSSGSLTDYFGSGAFREDFFLQFLRTFGGSTGLCRFNAKTRSFTVHPCLKDYISGYTSSLPQDVRSALKICMARQYLKQQKFYYAFCEFFLAGDYNAAAECSNSQPISLRDLLDTKKTLTEFIEKCPLNNKELIPRYLRVLAMLMLTSEKNNLRGNFRRAIEHISASPEYDAKERRRMLSYAYALRTYEDFFFVERMGNHIKRAYEYFDGTGSLSSPFYTWNMYVPSLFGLIHNYALSLKTEREQFGRFHTMYSEILNHGKFILDYYNAESAYFTGDLALADSITTKLLEFCKGRANDAPRLIGLLMLGKTAVFSGEYETYERIENSISDILHKTEEYEVYMMAKMSLAMLDMTCGNIKYSAFFACCKDDEEIRLNRFAAPYYCLISALYRLSLGMVDRILENEQYYFSITDEVRNGTVRHQLYIIIAEALFISGNDEAAARYAEKALGVIEGTSIYMPAAEVLVHCRKTREYYQHNTPESAVVLRACRAAEKFILGSDTILTYKLTKIRRKTPAPHCAKPQPPEDFSAAKQLGLTKKEYAVSTLAAQSLSNEEISQKLSISIDSVKGCLKRTFAKTGVRSRNGLEALFAAHTSPEKNKNKR